MEERVPTNRQVEELPNQHGRSLSSFDELSVEHGRSLSSCDVENDDDNGAPRPLVLAQPVQQRETNTLVIQIPKDQIYRVPPPENAKFVEAFRNPVNKKGKPRCTFCFWVFLILLLLGLSIGIATLVVRNVYKPEAITFSIVDVHVTNKTHVGYAFTLKSKNPSDKFGLTILSGGGTALISKSKRLSTGKFPELSLEEDDSKNVHITLNGTKSELPKEIDQSMNDKKLSDDHQVPLELKIHISAEFKMWVLKLWGKKDIDVDCKFKVNSLKNSGNKILSQKCESHIK